ncbi:mitochondrial carrier protein [Trypanosoma rangeli]|uniref:Mitochondrial carrier protein n=1 Tax=Trypanosoma rangeli TaxID=5698 RepID=A0A3R7M746_TRYRA|nr:mitochondrial carrier protein [Trypanosoma rangeli]RNF10278.1 mitochondrial carrier protein [Trypanosoma rangeli]|eukprot:RNF10278.1 mitochondrial carrier protein [Trypanosoma rangeli]
MGEGRQEREAQQPSLSSHSLHTSSVALASAAATVFTKSFLHPLDTLKCRLQCSSSKSLLFVWREYAGKWGPRYVYGGLPVKLVCYVPYQAIYMTTYNAVRDTLNPAGVGNDTCYVFFVHTFLAASAAELSSCIVRVPMETAKMRIQATAVPNSGAAIRQIIHHGFFACTRLVKAQTLLHDVPYSVIQWICYESLRPWGQSLRQRHQLHEEPDGSSRLQWYVHSFLRTFLTGGFSGLLASTITVPLDTIRTRVVVASAANPSTTVRSVVRDTYRRGGVAFFFRGGCTRVVWVSANMAMYFPLYEIFKMELLHRQEPVVREPL